MGAMHWKTLPGWIGRRVPVARRGHRADPAGIAPGEWDEIRRAFPDLPEGLSRKAARSRRRLGRRCARALRSGRWDVRAEGDPPSLAPAVYVTAHVGGLQVLRYALRSRGVAAATVLGPHNLERPEAALQDEIFDSRYPMDFPQVLPAARVHRLRTALRSGSLLMAADLAAEGGFAISFFGGRLRLDPRPIRLARMARVPCRPAFLTLPDAGWTLTLGPELPAGEEEALTRFGELFIRVAARTPWDLDGVVYRGLARGLA